MKLITLILTVCIVHISASSYSQSQKISMDVRNYPLEKVFQEIEKQTNFRFLYRLENVENETADITADNSSLEQILNKLLNNRDITYKILENNLIVITPSEKLQIRKVTGTVTDASTFEPLPGVNITIEGTTIGTVTDNNGRFTLELPSDNLTILFSYLGYVTERIEYKGQSTIDLNMVPDIKKLDEVVVIGYGTKIKRDITGSMASLNAEELSKTTTSNVTTALQGRTSGVQISGGGSVSGGYANVRVRGVASINSGSDPLIVVDGIPMNEGTFTAGGFRFGGLSEINPNDIASLEVLKDASASAIYGSRAANGVILVTTKKGKAGKSKVSISYQHGITTPSNQLTYANGDQWRQIASQAWFNRDPSTTTHYPLDLDNWMGFNSTTGSDTLYNQNWDKYLGDGSYDQVSASISGGDNKTQFYTSFNYNKDNSNLKGTKFDKSSLRLNLDHKVSDFMSVGFNLSASVNNRDFKTTRSLWEMSLTKALPIYPMYAPDESGQIFYNYDKETNPEMLYKYSWNKTQAIRTLDLFYLDLNLLRGLKFRSEWGIDYQFNDNKDYRHPYIYPAGKGNSTGNGKTELRKYQNSNWNVNNILTYTKSFGEHDFTIMGGFNIQDFLTQGTNTFQEGFPTYDFVYSNAASNKLERVSSSYTDSRLVSAFGRLSYKFKNKYLLDLSYRGDGSTKFSKENRWGYFPGGSIAWIISQESFMKNLEAVNFAKIRLSYGFTGNQSINDFQFTSNTVNWATNGNYPGLHINNLANPSLKWESTREINVGLDYGLFGNRISGNIDYFVKTSYDLLLPIKISGVSGFESSDVMVNIGEIENKGIEFAISSTNINTSKFSWKTDFNITHIKTIVNKLSNQSWYAEANTNRIVEGYPLGSYYLTQWAGVDPNTGHELIYEIDQNQYKINHDIGMESQLSGYVIDAETMKPETYNNHRIVMEDKSPYPKFYGGLGNTFSYNGFELYFLVNYQLGNWIYDQGERKRSYIGQNNVTPDLVNGWSASSPTYIPLIWGSSMAGRESSRFLHNGSYARLRNVEFSYNLPLGIINRMRLSKMRVYVSGQNLWTYTKFKGYDPETVGNEYNSTANISPGVIGFDLPQVRTMMFGVELSF